MHVIYGTHFAIDNPCLLYKAKGYVDCGVARIIFVVKFGAVAWIIRVTQFAVIPCRNVRIETFELVV
jgi:hypothetical protein